MFKITDIHKINWSENSILKIIPSSQIFSFIYLKHDQIMFFGPVTVDIEKL